MSKSKEVVSYFGRCRCCLAYSYLKNMWTEYYREDEPEVYADMLKDCYGFSFEVPESADNDQICETCIEKLRDALAFRKLILESNDVLVVNVADDEAQNKVKVEVVEEDENVNVQIIYEDDDAWKLEDMKIQSQDTDNAKSIDFDEESQMDEGKGGSEHKGSAEEGMSIEEYEDIEFLEEDVDTKQNVPSNDNGNQAKPVRKWPKKLPRIDRNRRYKQYTEDELQMCLEAVRDGTMTSAEASGYYNIPQKTIVKKLRSGLVERDEKQDQIYQFHKEIKSILSFTNGTPYKSTIVKYSCIYCLEAVFTDAEELRNHTRTVHIDERTKKVDIFMRPHWENEILKLDIENLLCVVCCTLIPEWNDMLQHLEEVHSIQLDKAYTRVIPYILESDLKCALCKASFANYLQLDGHMNSHYENYVCSECGDHYLTQTRLKAHQKTHEIGRFPCEVCNKVFTQQKYMRKHVRLVHQQNLNFKCAHCDDMFPSEVSRQNHLQQQHLEKIKPIHCDECDKVFYWRQYYTAHKRKQHGEKKHGCCVCEKRFYRKYQLEEHLISHSGVKSVKCPICHKDYMTKSSLRVHLAKQHRKKVEVADMTGN